MAKVSMRDNKKKKRTSRNNTGCVTTRCCIECPKPSTRKRRRKLASRSLPLSRAMPMPIGSLLNIMPSPMLPLNIPIPRVEANRRPFGTYQFNNQPVRQQQSNGRRLGTVRDTQARGVTNQNLPITNPPRQVPPSRLLRKETPPNPIDLPNVLDLQGTNAEAVSNQGQNLRQNRGVAVAASEVMRMEEDEPFNIGRGLSGRGLRRREARQNEGVGMGVTEFMTVRSNLRPTSLGRRTRKERAEADLEGQINISQFGVTSGPLIRAKDEDLNMRFPPFGEGAGAGAMTPTPPSTPNPTRVASDTGTNVSDDPSDY